VPALLIAGHERESITYMGKSERRFPDTAPPEVPAEITAVLLPFLAANK
jgi:hypothetical protein